MKNDESSRLVRQIRKRFARIFGYFFSVSEAEIEKSGLDSTVLRPLRGLQKVFDAEVFDRLDSGDLNVEFLEKLALGLEDDRMLEAIHDTIEGGDGAIAYLGRFVDSILDLFVSEFGPGVRSAIIHLSEQEIRDAISIEKAAVDSISRENSHLKFQLQQLSNDFEAFRRSEEEKFNKRAEELRSKLETFYENQRSAFHDTTAKAIEKMEVSLNSQEQSRRESLLQFEEKAKKKVSSLISEAEAGRDEIKELANISAQESVSFEFKHRASQEAKEARFWRRASVFAISLAVIWIIFSLFGADFLFYRFGIALPLIGEGHSEISDMIKQAAVTIILLLSAAYFSKQAAMHREEARQSHRTAMELNAIDPYINSLPVDKQHELKEKMADRFFSNTQKSNLKDEHFEPISVAQLASAFSQILKK